MRNRTIAGLVACAVRTLASVAHAADPVKVCGLRFTSSAANFIAVEKGYYANEGLRRRPCPLRCRAACRRGRFGGRLRYRRHRVHGRHV